MPAIALTAIALAGIVLSGVFAPARMLPSATLTGRLGLIAGATAVACALFVTHLVIQNGIAVVFPAWIRITPTATAGGAVEIMGQSLVVSGPRRGRAAAGTMRRLPLASVR